MTDIIVDSLNYYDLNNENNKWADAKYIKFIRNNNDIKRNVIIFYDKDRKELYKSEYIRLCLQKKSAVNSNTEVRPGLLLIPTSPDVGVRRKSEERMSSSGRLRAKSTSFEYIEGVDYELRRDAFDACIIEKDFFREANHNE